MSNKALVIISGQTQQIPSGNELATGTGLDRATAGTLIIGSAVATAITLTPATTVTGALYANGGIDRSTAAVLAVGATNATSVLVTPRLNADGNIDKSSAATLTIGATSASSVEIGKVGALTTIKGNFQVDGTETIVGITTFQNNVNLGNGGDTINVGSGVTDTVAVQGLISGNLTFTSDANHTIDVNASAAATTGRTLTVSAGAGGAAAAGGPLSLNGGAGNGATFNGGLVQSNGGAGGNTTGATAAGNGGDNNSIGGNGGTTSAAGAGGQGGQAYNKAGDGGATTGATTAGTGGPGYLLGGTGGAGSATGLSGYGGNSYLQAGNAGATGGAGQSDGGDSFVDAGTGANAGQVKIGTVTTAFAIDIGKTATGRLNFPNAAASTLESRAAQGLNLTGKAASTWSTTGALTITATATSTWQATGALTTLNINGDGALNLQGGGVTGVNIGSTGNVAVGATSAQTVTFTAQVAGDVTFNNAANHVISIATTAATVAGKAFTWTAGAGGTDAAGGNNTFNGGAGGASSAGSAGNGGFVINTGGVGGAASAAGAAGNGGPVQYTGGIGGAGDTGFDGGPGGSGTLQGGVGGAGETGNLAGDGGAISIRGGSGGLHADTNGGNGGNIALTGGNGGAIGNSNGGSINLEGGVKNGTGTYGSVTIGANGFTAAASIAPLGAVTITAGASSSWGTSSGALTIYGTTGINLQYSSGATKIAITSTGFTLTGQMTINGSATTATVTGANLTELTDGSTTTLHTHSSGTSTNISFAATSGEAINAGAPVSLANSGGSPRIYHSDANGAGNRVHTVGISNTTIAGVGAVTIYVAGERAIPDAIWDAAGGVPAVGDVGLPVYVSETVGQLTILAPTANATVQRVGIVTVGGTGAVKIAIMPGWTNTTLN